MKLFPAFLFFLFCSCGSVFSQKIQYSRTTLFIPNQDEMQLVANIAGNHHLVSLGTNRKLNIYIFNSQLSLLEKKGIDFVLKTNADLKVLPFKDHYFLYHHELRSRSHELWRVDANGVVSNLTRKFKTLVDSLLNKSNTTLQLIAKNESFYAISHVYYDSLERVISTVARMDSALHVYSVNKVFYPFAAASEILQQTELAGNWLLVLKTSKDIEKGNTLDLTKIDLTTGESVTNSFTSTSHTYSSPGFTFNFRDSSLLIYSMLREPAGGYLTQRSIFISRLDKNLKETVPVSVLNSQLKKDAPINFLLVDGQPSQWLNLKGAGKLQKTWTDSLSRALTAKDYTLRDPDYSHTSYNRNFSLRLCLLDKQFKLRRDSIIANDKYLVEVQPYPYAQFEVNNKSYLLLVQNYTSKKRSLLMVSSGNNGFFSTDNLPVYDRYAYLLSQLQAVNGEYFIVPFADKNNVGLVKVTLNTKDY
jgi:hypothetical protein